jgi:hypothetical protein
LYLLLVLVCDGCKKNPDFVQKQKKILPSAHFGLFLPSGPTVLAHWTTVDHEHGPLCTREPEKTILRPIFGP